MRIFSDSGDWYAAVSDRPFPKAVAAALIAEMIDEPVRRRDLRAQRFKQTTEPHPECGMDWFDASDGGKIHGWVYEPKAPF